MLAHILHLEIKCVGINIRSTCMLNEKHKHFYMLAIQQSIRHLKMNYP